jgi:hypothetical protein
VASLQLLSRACVYKAMAKMDHVQQLPLPCRMQDLVGMLFIPTIRVSMENIEEVKISVLCECHVRRRGKQTGQ